MDDENILIERNYIEKHIDINIGDSNILYNNGVLKELKGGYEEPGTYYSIIFYIVDSLKRGERVDMRGFGSFVVKQRPPRDARNPATSEVVKLSERFDPIFKVSKLLKKSVNQSLLRGF